MVIAERGESSDCVTVISASDMRMGGKTTAYREALYVEGGVGETSV